jgi:LmbE family N-acetylglucosaminyl deacetylase
MTAGFSDARRILILAPHPDDEVAACGIAAMRAAASGARVFALCLTTGVPAADDLWPWRRKEYAARVARRRAEAEAAAALIGLEPIGFGDRPSRRLCAHLDEAFGEIERALADSRAEALWVPAFEGAHQDHDAANAVAASLRNLVPIWEFAAYNFAGGRVNTHRFPAQRGDEAVVVPNAAEAALKRRALARYTSERGNLRHIRIEREVCRPLPQHDYGSPPHPGRLFRERFHWVPFRHPRIDFMPSAEVYAAIGRWASARDRRPSAALGQSPSSKAGEAHRELAGALDQAQSESGIG